MFRISYLMATAILLCGCSVLQTSVPAWHSARRAGGDGYKFPTVLGCVGGGIYS